MRIDGSEPWLDGHFDKRAVLPGVLHAGLALEIVNQARADASHAETLKFKSLKAFKCTQLVLPPAELQMQITYKPERNELRFISKTLSGTCASGIIGLDLTDATRPSAGKEELV